MYLIIISPIWSNVSILDYAKENVANHCLPEHERLESISSFSVAEVYNSYVVNIYRIAGYPDTKVLLSLYGDEFKHLDNVFTMRRFLQDVHNDVPDRVIENMHEYATFLVASQLSQLNTEFYLPKRIHVLQEKAFSTVWLFERWNGWKFGKLPYKLINKES